MAKRRPQTPEQTRDRRDAALLAERIKQAREWRGKSRDELAEAVGVTRTAVVNYEKARSRPCLEVSDRLASALGVAPAWLRPTLFDGPQMRAAALSQLSLFYGLAPGEIFGVDVLKPTNPFMADLLKRWAEMAGGDEEKLYKWESSFSASFDPSCFPARYERVGNSWRLVPKWSARLLSLKLRSLRAHTGLGGWEAAQLAGMGYGTYRTYEQLNRAPKRSTLRALASAFQTDEAALTFYDFGDPNEAAQALLQLADEMGLEPRVGGRVLAACTQEARDAMIAMARLARIKQTA